MDQEFSFEAPPFEFEPEFDGEFLEEQGEWGRRGPRRGGPGTGSRPRGPLRVRPRRIPPGRKPTRGKVGPRRPWGTFTTPYPYAVEPAYATAPAGSEQIRWAQDCLNKILGIQIAVTGIAGPETRSAVRSFQQARGLRVSGIVGPDTVEALRAGCDDRSGQMGVDGGEIQEEPELGPLTATLRWTVNQAPGSPRSNTLLFSRAEARNAAGGGVYIAVDTTPRPARILKVGETTSFRKNPGLDQRYVEMERARPGLQFYLATIYPGRVGGHGVGGVSKMIEKAIARLLYRAGESLPEDNKPFVPTSVLGKVQVRNILPPPLIARLRVAYRASGTDPRGRTIPPNQPGTRPSGAAQTLILNPAIYPIWELPPW